LCAGTLGRSGAVWFRSRDEPALRELAKVSEAGGFPFPCVRKDEASCTVKATWRKAGEQTPQGKCHLFVDIQCKAVSESMGTYGAPLVDAHQPYG